MAEANTAYLFCLLHDETVTAELCFEEHRRIGESIEAPVRALQRGHDSERDGRRGLRIGFVSGDLRDHAVANLVEPAWTAMRGGRHKIFAYANIDAEDAVSARLRGLADEWVRVERLDDTTLASRIRADRIDILFDLSGHTTGNRLAVFAMKPAPVQASWLGYPATTGLPAIDYRFVHESDANAGAADAFFTEKLVRLQRRGIRPELSAPAVSRLPALATGQLTFGSFGRPAKISESTIALWCRALRAVPGSRMLIASVDEARTRQRLLASFVAQGIAAERLQFQSRMPLASYLALHQQVDIVLDTMPFAGETTTHHALWMGVPVLTRLGRTLQQNQGGAIVSMLGLSEWAADSDSVFVQRAVSAAADLEGLDTLRQGLRDRMRAAFVDSTDAVRLELDTALQTIWRRWRAGLQPESFFASL
jgi:predicted O-linked N-acetylglucosamine transferase (SPINDLY family)